MAGNAGAIRAGRAYYELYAETNPLLKGLKQAETLVKASVVAAAGVAATALVASVKVFRDMGTELFNVSKRTGASAESLSTLGYAAKQTGGNLQTVEGLLTVLRDKTIEAARGSEQAQVAFFRLGLNFLKLSTMRPEDRLRAIADRLNQIQNPAIRAAAAIDLLGTADVLPTLERMRELEDRAERLGLVLSDKDAAAAKRFDESLTDLWETIKFTGVGIAAELAPALEAVTGNLKDAASGAREWVSANKDVIGTIADLITSSQKAGQAFQDFLGGGVKSGGLLHDAIEGWTGLGRSISEATEKVWSFGRAYRSFKSLIHYLRTGETSGAAPVPVADVDLPPVGAGRPVGAAVAKRPLKAINAKSAAAAAAAAAAAGAAAMKDEKRPEKPGNGKDKSGAIPGIGSALFQVKGISGADIRTTSGFSAVLASLRQQQNPMLGILNQAYAVQKEQGLDMRRVRIVEENRKVAKI